MFKIYKCINYNCLSFLSYKKNDELKNIYNIYKVFKNYGYSDDRILIAKTNKEFIDASDKINKFHYENEKFIVLLCINNRMNKEKITLLNEIEFFASHTYDEINNIIYIIYFTTPSIASRHVNNFLILKIITCAPFDDFVIHRKLSNHRICNICKEKKYSFKICYRCSFKYCINCFYNFTKIILICPYCRYEFHEHIKHKIEILNKI